MPFDNPNEVKWTRDAFISSLPKHCLKCFREGVSVKDRKLVCEVPGYNSEEHRTVAACMHSDCGAVFAQYEENENVSYLRRHKLCRSEVIFVRTLPYHIPLGGRTSQLLDENDFVKPGTMIMDGEVWTGLVTTPHGVASVLFH
ncbi:MAG: hypothetical protein ACM3TU_01535 [Bacillota bacterium]